jgi:superfamily II RNA helicase
MADFLLTLSCRECEKYAQDMARLPDLDFNTPSEKESITEIFNAALKVGPISFPRIHRFQS